MGKRVSTRNCVMKRDISPDDNPSAEQLNVMRKCRARWMRR